MYIRSCVDRKLWLIFLSLLVFPKLLASAASTEYIYDAVDKSVIDKTITVTRDKVNESGVVVLLPQELDVRWYRKLPLAKDYDNTVNCRRQPPCIKPITYKLVENNHLKNRAYVKLDELTANGRLGTHRYEIMLGERKLNLSVIVRRDDTYVGYVTELIGVPFVYGPGFRKHGGHQTDLREGADCIATVIYGMRRMGEKLPYFAPARLYDYTDIVGDSSAIRNVNITEGDILHFGFQTAIISKDIDPKNVLNNEDMVIHSYHEVVEEVRFSELPYKNSRFDVLRWADRLRLD